MKKFLLIQFLFFLSFAAHAADESETTATPTAAEGTCIPNLTNVRLRGLTVNEVEAGAAEYKISQVADLAKDHPLMVMSSDQKAWAAIRRGGYREVMNPHYRAEKTRIWNVFSSGVPEADGRRIIGQLDAIQTFVDWIRGRAEGRTDAGMLIFVGPGGTGKTFFANISTSIIESLNRDVPDFYRFTYKWTERIRELPGLEELVGPTGRVNLPPTGRSPLTLFPVEMQKKIYSSAYKKGSEMLGGLDPLPKLGPHIQTEQILQAIIKHQAKAMNKSVREIMTDETLYNAALEPYINIVRVYTSSNAVSPVVRYPGDKLPDLETLFGAKDLERNFIWKTGHPFSYNYNGAIPRLDGSLLATDEILRWPGDLLNFLLEVSENGVVQISGMPALKIDVVMMGATNDESVEAATQNGSIKAFKDRSTFFPMRYALHPLEIAQTTMVMLAKENTSIFLMRKLNGAGQPAGEMEPFVYDKVFPPPSEDGILLGPDNRYAVYVRNGADQPTLIAPRTLMMLGLIAGSTHMINDPSKLKENEGQLNSLTDRNTYYSDLVTRLKILTGDLRAEEDSAIRLELSRWQKMGKEGSSGISNRDAQRWLSLALADARNANETSLTPKRLQDSFRKMLDTKGFTESGTQQDAEWTERANQVRAQMILPYIKADVMNILRGGSGEAERLYDEIKGELLARNTDREATEWSRNGERRGIRQKRLDEINAIYFKGYQKHLSPSAISNYHAQNQDGTRDPELLDAIKQFLLAKEFEVTVYGEVLAYFEGQSVDPKIREMGMAAEKNMASYGYDRNSFIQALSFIEAMERVIAKQQQQQQP